MNSELTYILKGEEVSLVTKDGIQKALEILIQNPEVEEVTVYHLEIGQGYFVTRNDDQHFTVEIDEKVKQ